ncbi:MAG: hypothetical protein NVS4B10_01130 [Myxococcales bacterium]
MTQGSDAFPATLNRLSRQIAEAFATSSTLREAVPRLLESVGGAFGFDAGLFWEPDEPQHALHFASLWRASDVVIPGFEAASRARTFAPGEGLPGRVWQSGALVIPDLAADPAFPRREAAAREPLRSAAGFPLAGASFAGVLEFFHRTPGLPAEPLLAAGDLLSAQAREFLRRVAAQRAAHHSEARRAAMLEAALDSIVSMDARGRVTDWNPAAFVLFGFSPEEAIGREMAELIIPERFREAHRRGLARHLATGKATVLGRRLEMSALRKDGVEIPVELTIVRIRTEGEPAFTGYLRDLSERRRAEEEAKSEVAFREHLLGIVGHDLRNPLSAVLVSATMLSRQKDLSAQQRKPVHQILASASRMKSIIANLLDYTHVKASGGLHLERRSVDAHALTRRAVAELQASNPGRAVEIEARGDGAGSWDPDRLEQVVSNLVSNALKYGEPGTPVHLASVADALGWTLTVRNAGEPIAAELLPRVFEPFTRGSQTQETVRQSLGLGLYIADHLVRAHGGAISVASTAGEGTVFTVRIPRATALPGGGEVQ